MLGIKIKFLQLYDEFDWSRFPKLQIIFFIDRDLSNFLNESLRSESNIFITDNYSIENDIVNRNTCDRVLTEVCKLNNIKENEKEKILNLFDNQLDIFQDRMVTIMSWIIYWKRSGCKPSLDNIEMKHLFKLQKGRLRSILRPRSFISHTEYIHKKCGIDYKPRSGIRTIAKEFRKVKGNKKFVRGKYILWFFVEYVLSIHGNANFFSKKIASS